MSFLLIIADERGVARHCMTVELQPHDRTPIAMHVWIAPVASRFYLEALQDLSRSLTARGSSLYFSLCSPAEGIAHLAKQLAPEATQLQLYHYVYSGHARASEETAVAAAFR